MTQVTSNLQCVFLDWSTSKPITILKKNDESAISLKSIEELTHLAPIKVFLEAGCPHHLLYMLIEKGCEIYDCDPKHISKIRGASKKSDEIDVNCIRQLWMNHPDYFHFMTIPEQKDFELNFLMKRYLHFMTDCARFKNRQTSYKNELGENTTYEEIIDLLERKKKECIKELRPLLRDEMVKISDIKGLSIRYLAGLLVTAHPRKFPSLSKYLAYCGYKGSTWQGGKGKYSRAAKTIVWQMTKSLIIHKDKRFYALYLKIKEDLKLKNANCRKVKLDRMTINRLSTFLLKDLYSRFSKREQPSSKSL